MSEPEKKDDPGHNLFKVMDGIIYQLNATKRLFIIMILSMMILPPIALLISSLLIAPPFQDSNSFPALHRDGFGVRFFDLRILPLVISLVWLGIGIRQWFILSKWTKRYVQYKKMQENIDKKLADTNDNLPG